jgi:hypothetical protein
MADSLKSLLALKNKLDKVYQNAPTYEELTVKKKGAGNRYMCPLPGCEDGKSAALAISEGEGRYYCHRNGESLDHRGHYKTGDSSCPLRKQFHELYGDIDGKISDIQLLKKPYFKGLTPIKVAKSSVAIVSFQAPKLPPKPKIDLEKYRDMFSEQFVGSLGEIYMGFFTLRPKKYSLTLDKHIIIKRTG